MGKGQPSCVVMGAPRRRMGPCPALRVFSAEQASAGAACEDGKAVSGADRPRRGAQKALDSPGETMEDHCRNFKGGKADGLAGTQLCGAGLRVGRLSFVDHTDSRE